MNYEMTQCQNVKYVDGGYSVVRCERTATHIVEVEGVDPTHVCRYHLRGIRRNATAKISKIPAGVTIDEAAHAMLADERKSILRRLAEIDALLTPCANYCDQPFGAESREMPIV